MFLKWAQLHILVCDKDQNYLFTVHGALLTTTITFPGNGNRCPVYSKQPATCMTSRT